MREKYRCELQKITLFFFTIFIILVFIRPFKIDISKSNKVMTFSVLSDVHINGSTKRPNDNFENALNILLNRAPNLSAVFVAGDLTDNGWKGQYDQFMDIYTKNSYSVPLYAVMGNHDYWNGLSLEESQNLFMEETNQELKSHEVIEGMHFLKLGTENTDVNGYYSDESLKWLDSELASLVNENLEKPIFVITHHPSKDTVYGSKVFGNKELNSVLKKYPQVIHFAGHSHYTLDDERSILQRDYTMLNTASVSYGGTEVNGSVQKVMDLSAGLLVNVYDDNTITIEKLAFTTNESIKDKWIIRNPSDKSNYIYTDKRKEERSLPYFEENSIVTVGGVGKDGCIIKFPQGKHSDYVHAYKIEIYNNVTKESVQTFYKSAEHYYGTKQPDILEIQLEELMSDTEYEVRVYAQESFGKLSDKYIKTIFKTETE